MTPQQSVGHHSKVNSDESRIPEKEKKMKTTLQRRHSGQTAITKAFSKPKGYNRDAVPVSSQRAGLIQSLMSHGSECVLEERVQLSTGLQTQERHLFLFSDILIIAKSKSSSSLKLKERVRLCEVWLASCMEEVAERKLSSKNSFVIGWPITNYVVTLGSSEAKEKWLSALQWHIDKSKEVEYPCNVNMKVVQMDIGNSAMATVNVTNKDDADKVIGIVTQQMGLSGRPADYRLWVVSGKEEAPYPLIGHEHPFSIILNCLKEGEGQGNVVINNLPLPTVDGKLYLDQRLKEAPVPRFILRQKAPEGAHIRADSSQRHIKRKRSLIDWALRRGHAGRHPDSPATSQKLFGHSLFSICRHGILPRPIMDMLYLLYHEGPTTTGIFRRSANAKTCRELKEKLNSGNSVQLEGESVFVAASVITDFLRNLPGSVLCTTLYDQWMQAMGTDSIEDKIDMIKSLLNLLPGDNVTLLRYLFALLYHIQEHSQENQMNAFNLALCIAPNMLWLPTSAGPEEESLSTKKVAALIQLLIENTPAIFGEDVQSVFAEPRSGQGTMEDVMVESYQHFYSSDCSDWVWERQGAISASERESLFLPLRKLVLKEEEKIFGLLDDIDSLKKQNVNDDSAYSCGNLDLMSSLSSGSICSLMGTQRGLHSARDRCSSEPSVCLGSPPPHGQLHAPVARQSSCDAAVMCGGADHGQHTSKLPAKGLNREGSPRVTGGRSRYAFWRSPQVASRFWHPAQRLAASNRSSLSSLSSAATSPSVSSLSSIDSAFSIDSSADSASSLPFLFGSAARLRPLTPDTPKRFPKDWSMTFPSSVAQAPEDLDWYDEYDEREEDGNVHGKEHCHSVSIQKEEIRLLEFDSHCETRGRNQPRDHRSDPDPCLAGGQRSDWRGEPRHDKEEVSETSDSKEQSRKTSSTHIQLRRTDNPSGNKEEVKRTKITFYTASNRVVVKKQSEGSEEGCGGVCLVSNQGGEDGNNVELLSRTVQVHIPQTVFYGQDTPLVLQSVSTRQAVNIKDNTTVQTDIDHSNLVPAHSVGCNNPSSQTPTKSHSKAASTISHTIRIKLPATVRNTVREYFSSGDSKSCQSNTKAMEKELLISKLQWHSKMAEAKEKPGKLSHGEESFL